MGKALILLFKLVVTAIVVAIPLLGVWVASSLAAFWNGPIWAAILAGLFFFPVFPLAWEAWSNVRRRKKGATGRRFLRFFDRMILRTLTINLLFVGGLLIARPESVFTSISARGDWMLEGRTGPAAESARGALYWIANQLEWVYLAAHENPYAKYAQKRDTGRTPPPRPRARPDAGASPPDAGASLPDAGAAPPETDAGLPERPAEPTLPNGAIAWPLAPELHPIVKSIPPEHESSPESVARYIALHADDPVERVKALHDYVADRIWYDDVALAAGRYPDQGPALVFASKTGVCAGYANLFLAMARTVGINSELVVGQARASEWGVGGEAHAWNAVEIDGEWYLLDVTWDSKNLLSKKDAPQDSTGGTAAVSKVRRYRTDYLFTPPEIFGLDHFPDNSRWQLRDEPLTRGEFIRQPHLSPRFSRQRFKLIAPDRSQVDASGRIEIVLDNPLEWFVLAHVVGAGVDTRCNQIPANARSLTLGCDLPFEGPFKVLLFSNTEAAGSYDYIAHVLVTNKR